MESMESCVPPGFRFHPTDEELVGYYLRKKVASQKIDLDVIREVDLYRIEPWDLKERCRVGYEEQSEWYFFSHKDKKYPTGTRTNRATIAGFWKATGRDKAVYDKARLIGMRKTLVFYKGRAPSGQKTDWIMHEYRLESNENAPPQEEGWVVCRAFKKRTTTPTKTSRSWLDKGSSYFNDEPSSTSSTIDPSECISRPTQQEYLASQFLCKQEVVTEQALAADNLSIFSDPDDYFLHLPHLEGPSVPQIKSKTARSDVDSHCKTSVTDWRALDKFVASQLSQEEKLYEVDVEATTSLDHPGNQHPSSYQDRVAASFLLLEDEGDNGDGKLSGFLSSSDGQCDVGIYMSLGNPL
ncbi:hypothetical protein MLD38_007801 [Melastoma candidum]|uniref:Uncharacterized protein n=1 Tax=Melastoma candidum TaxID=119954 RepID=A0ACB9RVA5_9MYRT|nr:hypothetical protein MLD38_007801 [Melastoma candidum]